MEERERLTQQIRELLEGGQERRLTDLVEELHPADLASALPDYAIVAMREAFVAFDKQIRGYYKEDAVLTGVETRTSSPIRIKRNDDDLQSLNTRGLFPAGEGAGYAGGIMSAAIDGIRVAEAVALSMAAR